MRSRSILRTISCLNTVSNVVSYLMKKLSAQRNKKTFVKNQSRHVFSPGFNYLRTHTPINLC
ncbi:unnamed protein product [Brassica oleracea]